jgi:Uma2 family endonuclease
MPVALEALEPAAAQVTPAHKLWSRGEYAALEKVGIPLRQYELIEGELIKKMPKSHAHMRAILLLVTWLRGAFGDLRVVQEPSIDVSPEDNPSNEPEPDAVVLNRSFLEVAGPIRPGDIVILAEVSLSSLLFDLSTKAKLYSRAGIAEYWVIDIPARRLIVHRQPSGDTYLSKIAYQEDELVASLASPSVAVRVGDLL